MVNHAPHIRGKIVLNWLRYKWQLMLLTRKRKNAINIETATWATLAEDAKMEHLLKVGRTNIEPFEEDIDKLHSCRLSTRAQNTECQNPSLIITGQSIANIFS